MSEEQEIVFPTKHISFLDMMNMTTIAAAYEARGEEMPDLKDASTEQMRLEYIKARLFLGTQTQATNNRLVK